MRNLKLLITSLITFSLFFAVNASAGLINFETTPDGSTPTDNLALSSAYNLGDVSVAFSFIASDGSSSNPYFELIGTDTTSGFLNDGTTHLGEDTAESGYEAQLGDYFLRHNNSYTDFGTFRIQYSYASGVAASTAASGEIWDIDGGYMSGNVYFTEQYAVEAYDSAGNLIGTQISPLGNNYDNDGIPWVFAFSGLTAGIDHIDIDFTGTKTSGLGLAFNNFSATSAVPIPGAVWLLGSGLVGLIGIRRRKN